MAYKVKKYEGHNLYVCNLCGHDTFALAKAEAHQNDKHPKAKKEEQGE